MSKVVSLSLGSVKLHKSVINSSVYFQGLVGLIKFGLVLNMMCLVIIFFWGRGGVNENCVIVDFCRCGIAQW